jgi:hypothetical protein
MDLCTLFMTTHVVEDLSKYEKQRLKRNEYARQYRERNKSDIIDDASEERRIALNLKAKFYRDRRKAAKTEQDLLSECVNVKTTWADALDGFVQFACKAFVNKKQHLVSDDVITYPTSTDALNGYIHVAFVFIGVMLVAFIFITSTPAVIPTI